MIKVKSRIEGFRRAGLSHSKEWVAHKDDAFTEEQLAALEDEEMLTVVIVEGEEGDGQDLDEASRLEMIFAGVDKIDADDSRLWTKNSGPTVAALEAVTGLTDITAEERDVAFATPNTK